MDGLAWLMRSHWGAAQFTVLKYLDHCCRIVYNECTHCSRTVFSLLHVRATMHTIFITYSHNISCNDLRSFHI